MGGFTEMKLFRVTLVSRIALFRLATAVTAFLLADWAALLAQDGVFIYWRRTALTLGLGGLSLFFILLFALTWTRQSARFEKLLDVPLRFARLQSWNLVLFLLSVVGLASLYLIPATGTEFYSYPGRTLLFWLISLLGAFFLSAHAMKKDSETGTVWFEGLVVSLLVNGFVYKLLSYLGTINAYPFSLNWSEATRYYQASLLFSESLYGLHIPPFFQDFSRYVLEAIPFLLPARSLIIERAWDLFSSVTFSCSSFKVRSISICSLVFSLFCWVSTHTAFSAR